MSNTPFVSMCVLKDEARSTERIGVQKVKRMNRRIVLTLTRYDVGVGKLNAMIFGGAQLPVGGAAVFPKRVILAKLLEGQWFS